MDRGLGGALALRFGSEGFHVVLLGRRMSSLSAIQKEMHDSYLVLGSKFFHIDEVASG